jgi:hypothetical protein
LCITAKWAADCLLWVKTRMPPERWYVSFHQLRTCG